MTKTIKVSFLTVALVFAAVSFTSAQETTAEEIVTEAIEAVALDETVEASDLEVSTPTLLPDSPFYFFKNWGRGIRTFFTFNKVNKANLKAKYASEKLLEVRELIEKAKDPEIIKKALENYEKEVGKVKATADKIRGKASENLEVGKFLDKFTKHQILHQKVLEKLEEQIPEGALERIRETRENHMRSFGEVMLRLEKKAEIQTRLEKNLEELKGSEFKSFKNLEILKNLEEKVPEAAKEAIRGARENTLLKLKEKLEQMPTTTQERFRNYVEKIRGEAGDKIEILENLKSELKEAPKLRERLEGAREKIIEKLRK